MEWKRVGIIAGAALVLGLLLWKGPKWAKTGELPSGKRASK